MSPKEKYHWPKGLLTNFVQRAFSGHGFDEIAHCHRRSRWTDNVQEVSDQTGDTWGGHRRARDRVGVAINPGGRNV